MRWRAVPLGKRQQNNTAEGWWQPRGNHVLCRDLGRAHFSAVSHTSLQGTSVNILSQSLPFLPTMKHVFLLTNIDLEPTICEESLGYRNEQDKQSQFSHNSHSSGSFSPPPPNYTSDSQMVTNVYAEKQGRCQEAEWLTPKGSRTQGFEDWTDFGFYSKWGGRGTMWLILVGPLWLLCWKQVVKAWRSVKRQIYI